MKTLIIVDVQRDFYDPSGSLYVSGGGEIISRIRDKILNDLEINQVIFTVDWHTPEDKSFSINGGTWPVHCLQYSQGASLPKELLEAVMLRGFKSVDGLFYSSDEAVINKQFLSGTYDVFEKGDLPGEEEYGAFGDWEDEDEDIVCLTNASEESCAYLNLRNDIILCGLAGDYCVLETAKNLLSILKSHEGIKTGKLLFFEPGIRSIDGGKKLNEWRRENGLQESI